MMQNPASTASTPTMTPLFTMLPMIEKMRTFFMIKKKKMMQIDITFFEFGGRKFSCMSLSILNDG